MEHKIKQINLLLENLVILKRGSIQKQNHHMFHHMFLQFHIWFQVDAQHFWIANRLKK